MPTGKQRAFAQAIVDGLNQSDAYRLAYDAENMSPVAITVEASRLMDIPTVALLVDELRQTLVAAAVGVAAWNLDKQVNESATNLEGAREDRQWAAANGALTNIGKLTGTLIDRHEVSGHVTHGLDEATDQMLRELIERKVALEASTVDGEARLVDEEESGIVIADA